MTRAQLILRVSLVWNDICRKIFHELGKISVNLCYCEIKRVLQLLKPCCIVSHFVRWELEHLLCKLFENCITCTLRHIRTKRNHTVLLSRKFTPCFRTKNGIFPQVIVLGRLVQLKWGGSQIFRTWRSEISAAFFSGSD